MPPLHLRLPSRHGHIHVHIHVLMVAVVVPPIVALQPGTPVHQHVVVRIVVRGAVVVVHVLLGAEVVDDQVVVDAAPLHHQAGSTGAGGGEVGLPVPGVDGAVVAGLPAGRENQVVRHLIPSSESVVEIQPSPWTIEEHVASDGRPSCFRLEKEGGLLFVDPNLAGGVAFKQGQVRVVTVGPIYACGRSSGPLLRRLVSAPPQGDSCTSQKRKIRTHHPGLPVVSAEHQPVPVQTVECTPVHREPHGALGQDCPSPGQGPIPARRHGVGREEGRSCSGEGDASKGNIGRGGPAGRGNVHQGV
mmetsp:Transcript_22257/g.54656  ORF Transcript_22257/g.54656 Transcript_22257/m.54656 type:complete len:302 (+) Transcript_22257:421-1326(+)